jgi:hypothetical protein
VKKKLTEAQAEAGAAKKVLEDANTSFAALSKGFENKIRGLEDASQRDTAQITAARGEILSAQDKAKNMLLEVNAQREATLALRRQKSAVEKQANAFKSYQAELTDKIRELERQLETATQNKTDLLTQNGRTGP